MSALTKMRMFSPALGLCVTLDIVLPVRKDHAPGHKLPVLWLLHGAYGCHSDCCASPPWCATPRPTAWPS